jgi:hypothetical protein
MHRIQLRLNATTLPHIGPSKTKPRKAFYIRLINKNDPVILGTLRVPCVMFLPTICKNITGPINAASWNVSGKECTAVFFLLSPSNKMVNFYVKNLTNPYCGGGRWGKNVTNQWQ